MIDEDGESSDRHDKELGAESVVVAVVSGLELEVDEIDGGCTGEDIEHFHRGVVH